MSWENLSSEMCNQVGLKPAYSASKASYSFESFKKNSISRYYTIQGVKNKDCADAQADQNFCLHMAKDRFSHDMVHTATLLNTQ